MIRSSLTGAGHLSPGLPLKAFSKLLRGGIKTFAFETVMMFVFSSEGSGSPRPHQTSKTVKLKILMENVLQFMLVV